MVPFILLAQRVAAFGLLAGTGMFLAQSQYPITLLAVAADVTQSKRTRSHMLQKRFGFCTPF